MATQTRLTKREQQNLANWLSSLSSALKNASDNQSWERVLLIADALDMEAARLTMRTMGLEEVA